MVEALGDGEEDAGPGWRGGVSVAALAFAKVVCYVFVADTDRDVGRAKPVQ